MVGLALVQFVVRDSRDSQYPKFWGYWESRSPKTPETPKTLKFWGFWESRESRDSGTPNTLKILDIGSLGSLGSPRTPRNPKSMVLGVLGVPESNKLHIAWCLRFKSQWATDIYVKKASLEKMSLSLFMTRIKTLFHYLQFQFFLRLPNTTLLSSNPPEW